MENFFKNLNMLSTSLSVFGEKSVAQAHVVQSMHGFLAKLPMSWSHGHYCMKKRYVKRFTILVHGLRTSGGGGVKNRSDPV